MVAPPSPKVVGERHGHAGIQVTLDIYSHVLPSMQQRAAGTLGETFAAGEADQEGTTRDWLHLGYTSLLQIAVSVMGRPGFEPGTKGL